MDRVAVATIGDVLTHDVNMAQAEAGQGEPFKIAVFSGVPRAAEIQIRSNGAADGGNLALSWQQGEAILTASAWHEARWDQRLNLLQAVLALFDCIPKADGMELCWAFSGKTVLRADTPDLLERWALNRAPPVMDVIDIAMDNLPPVHVLRTIGLMPIFGYELQADIGTRPDRELARMVGRVAQLLLDDGPLSSNVILGPDGREYALTPIPRPPFGAAILHISEKVTG
ncbi:hypothetical protein BH09PSE3_BH09PSE3_06320 [soil metagenome]